MTTLHQNAPIYQLMRKPDCDDADPASLQIMTPDCYPIDSGGEIEYLNL